MGVGRSGLHGVSVASYVRVDSSRGNAPALIQPPPTAALIAMVTGRIRTAERRQRMKREDVTLRCAQVSHKIIWYDLKFCTVGV